MDDTAGCNTSIPAHLRSGLRILLQSHHYATDLNRSVWDFAVEIQTLHDAGMTVSDLRWLVCKTYVKHAREITLPGDDGREFRPEGNLTFGKTACFVLSEAGARFATENQAEVTTTNASNCLPRAENGQSDNEPHWDCDRNELRLGDLLVKEFKLPSPNQQTILAAFEEEGWPPRIDDPLPPARAMHPKRRLHDTINSLNRNHKNSVLRFMGDGTGTGIRWEMLRGTRKRTSRRR